MIDPQILHHFLLLHMLKSCWSLNFFLASAVGWSVVGVIAQSQVGPLSVVGRLGERW